jgi:hypothetical protein
MKAATQFQHRVNTYREAGLEAKWTRNRNGRPVIVARKPVLPGSSRTWFQVTRDMFETMKSVGVREGFERCTLLGDIFSTPA